MIKQVSLPGLNLRIFFGGFLIAIHPIIFIFAMFRCGITKLGFARKLNIKKYILRIICSWLFLFFFSSSVYSQPDSLNKYNAEGKKQGYWVEYLTKNMRLTTSNSFTYKRFQYYDNGKAVYELKNHNSKKVTYYFDKDKDYDSTNKLLSGKIIGYLDMATVQISEYSKGYPVKSNYLIYYMSKGLPVDTGYMEVFFFNRIKTSSDTAYHLDILVNGVQNILIPKQKYVYVKNRRGKWEYKDQQLPADIIANNRELKEYRLRRVLAILSGVALAIFLSTLRP